jgi:hypothetical protein
MILAAHDIGLLEEIAGSTDESARAAARSVLAASDTSIVQKAGNWITIPPSAVREAQELSALTTCELQDRISQVLATCQPLVQVVALERLLYHVPDWLQSYVHSTDHWCASAFNTVVFGGLKGKKLTDQGNHILDALTFIAAISSASNREDYAKIALVLGVEEAKFFMMFASPKCKEVLCFGLIDVSHKRFEPALVVVAAVSPQLGNEKAQFILSKLSRHSSPHIRFAVARSLGRMPQEVLVEERQRLSVDGEATVREEYLRNGRGT